VVTYAELFQLGLLIVAVIACQPRAAKDARKAIREVIENKKEDQPCKKDFINPAKTK